ncbi:MAG: helix-turn-helix domain-containing protein [Parasphingorhabdus sp.]
MAAEQEIEEEFQSNSELDLQSSGEMLRQAREQKQLSVEDIAKDTRIPQRHLTSIESGDFDALPGRTYAIGFAKSYARAVGLNDATIGTRLREEMEESGHGAYQPEANVYSPANPTSIPPKALALTAAGIGILVLVGYLIWRTLLLEPSTLASIDDEAVTTDIVAVDSSVANDTPAQDVSPPATTGTVILTATEPVWVKIYDEEGERLYENEMSPGDSFTVPRDANNPQILTGRPDALEVKIDGQLVAPLGSGERTIADVSISAAALLSRSQDQATDSNQQ